MTREEAIKWVQLDIDMAKFDPTTGEDAYLNDDAKNVIEAQEMAISALKAQMDGDVVSRNAIIKKLNAMDRYKVNELVLCDTDEKFPKNEVFIVDDVYEGIVEQLPSAQQWIPCSERLPDQNGKYLVVGRQKAINILKFDGGRWYGKWGVVAWMPLPSPYERRYQTDG